MNYITEIKPRTGKKGICEIYLDDGRHISTHFNTVKKNGLKVGTWITFDELSCIAYESDIATAYDRALKYLGYRARSCRELYNYLAGKGFASQVISAVVEKLKDYKYLDDSDFAVRWVENRNLLKPVSKRQLYNELKNKGIDNRILDDVLSRITEEDEFNNVYILAKKYLNKYRNLPEWEIRNKTGQALMRRGFNWDTVCSAVNKALSEVE